MVPKLSFNTIKRKLNVNFPFPKRGGGWGRRYWKFRVELLKRELQTPYSRPYEPIPIFDFSRPDDASDAKVVNTLDLDGWRISDDGVIGGYSTSRAHFVPAPPVMEPPIADSLSSSDDPTKDRHEEPSEEPSEELSEKDLEHSSLASTSASSDTLPSTIRRDTLPFIRWAGELDTTVGLESKFDRAGFATLRSPVFPFNGVNLKGNFEALEIVCRSDGRVYTVNLGVESLIEQEMFRGHIDVSPNPHGEFDKLYLPFNEFSLGQKTLEERFSFRHIGFTLMDGHEGPFQLDIARIRAVNFFRDKLWDEEKFS